MEYRKQMFLGSAHYRNVKEIMYRIRGKPLLITATFPLVLVHVLQQIYSHECNGLNARKQLLHNFYNSQFFEKYLAS